MSEVLEKAQLAKEASYKLANISTEIKNKALDAMAISLEKDFRDVIEANKIDIDAAIKKGMTKALIDRLSLDGKRMQEMIAGLDIVRKIPDPVGEELARWKRPNGLDIRKVRVPFGVIGIVYESRPNVTVDSASLCLKAGNAVILRGGSDAINSNIAITRIITKAVESSGFPKGSITLIESTDRGSVTEMLTLNKYIDVIIPRGGGGLIRHVVENSTVPVIETGEGNCHIYVESSADHKMAEDIAHNAKCQRPSVCNAAEKLLVDDSIAKKFLPVILQRLKSSGVEIRGDKKAKAIDPSIKEATEEDWEKEYLDMIMAVKVVSGIDEAIEHINKYGTRHSEAIITENKEKADKFTSGVDAAAVYVNASTRFTDGGEFGFGAEIGISTQKLHARGPMGLPELTSYKYIITGNGQIRK